MSTDQEVLDRAALEEDAARRVAYIMGPSSGAAKALAAVEASRAVGVPAGVVRGKHSWVVVRATTVGQEQGQEGGKPS